MGTYSLTPHQSACIDLVLKRKDLPYVFLIGGFGSGKSMLDVFLLLFLISQYKNSTPINIGLIGVTSKLLKRTVLKDLRIALDSGGIPYGGSEQTGIVTVGQVTITYLGMEHPEDIFAHNFNCCIVDELDELPAEKVLEVVKAVQERNRVPLPPPLSRDPFILFSTTAQGLGGTYQFTRMLKQKGEHFAVVHAKTADNPYIAKSQLERLRALYTEAECQAYLEGKFVNLAIGRVYPEFVRAKHLYMRFEPKPEETIYVGSDFNLGYNALVTGVERNGIIYLLDAWHTPYVGDNPRLLRLMYPTNPIVLIPDASGKEIMSGFVEEMDTHNIQLFWNNKNASITERVMAVNKLLAWGQMYVMDKPRSNRITIGDHIVESKHEQLVSALEIRDFDDAGKPRKGKGPDALDHSADSMEYLVWHVVHHIRGYEKILDVLRASFRRDEE